MKLYYVERMELHIIGEISFHYLVKAASESKALIKVGISDKTDESFGKIKELKDNTLDEANLLKGVLLAEIPE